MHIGIVACSAQGAALCYRSICSEAEALLGPHAHPEVSLHGISFADYVACLDEGDHDGVGELMLRSAHALARAGADFLICPDNTIHASFEYVARRSPLPWLHIAEVVAAEAARKGFAKVGLTGTRWLVDSEVYPQKLVEKSIEWQRPPPDVKDEINRIIMDELVHGVFLPRAIMYFQEVIRGFRKNGCDAVILGCTEIPLIINDANAVLPTLDSTRLLARAALHKACGEQEQK